ncbi:CPBP family intramembrane glutamic endopeptidase [Planococcus shenhongbingii]|uniref:Type II CAAX endopeptidase family protein n=1 Tax=Planococcus shenhongbingii TaxID=3058398 RepID=A0ABT8NHW3_9BACL|nr:type II CAAX endopeptidase family protein [Planococcus sp. N017]MDN7247040.1 type II CAAX endopeptidase family protein [Planococcus sp. N017]
MFANSQWIDQIQPKEWQLFLNRVSLLCVFVPLLGLGIFSDARLIKYWRKPVWNEFIYFPFIWTGFHRVKVSIFLMIALTVNFAIFMPLIFLNGWSHTREVMLLAVIFSLTNAFLEEMIWRGILLSRFSELFGDRWAVLLTSIGFGLQHYSLGFSWVICLAFSIGGMFFGGITIKSKSIGPSIFWHGMLNMLMVLSGIISL